MNNNQPAYSVHLLKEHLDGIVKNFHAMAGCYPGAPGIIVKRAQETVSPVRVMGQVKEINRYKPITNIRKFLEIGSGYSLLVAHLLKDYNIDAYGMEPAFEEYASYHLARDIFTHNGLPENRVLDNPAEHIPFPDNYFDVVYSNSVLEHVQAPGRVFSETVRVLKPGGMAIHNFPNYGSFWEGHYRLVFPLFLSKPVFKAYVGILGRDRHYANRLNFLTYQKILSHLKPVSKEIKIISTGQEIWEERVRSIKFSQKALFLTLYRFISLAHKLHVIEALIYIGKKMHWETPFLLVYVKM